MGIIYKTGDLFEAKVDALVNTVNTVGIMGKGVALAFRNRYPENFKLYVIACKDGLVQTGKMFITPVNDQFNRFIKRSGDNI